MEGGPKCGPTACRLRPYAYSMSIGFESMTLAAWGSAAPGTQLSGLDPAENTKACMKFAGAVFATANRLVSEQGEPVYAEVPAPFISARRDDQGGSVVRLGGCRQHSDRCGIGSWGAPGGRGV